jgi:hypothetical protein
MGMTSRTTKALNTTTHQQVNGTSLAVPIESRSLLCGRGSLNRVQPIAPTNIFPFTDEINLTVLTGSK